jgi:hypothetical protein
MHGAALEMHNACMSDGVTLHLTVPVGLYDDLARWASESGRTISDEAIAVLERESGRRREDWWSKVQALRTSFTLPPGAPRAEDLIREDRDHGHQV